MVEHCCGERVPKYMWAIALLCGDHRQVPFDEIAHFGGSHSLSVPFVEEEACAPFELLCESIAFCKILPQAIAKLISVRDDALFVALSENRIAGAAIDVFPKEPLGLTFPLVTLDNITLTNHRAGDTVNAYSDSPLMMLESLHCWIEEGVEPRFLLK